jgi:hypothetical protein
MELIDLQTIAQLMDNLDILTGKLEEAYNKKDAEEFKKAKLEILEVQKNINSMLENGN